MRPSPALPIALAACGLLIGTLVSAQTPGGAAASSLRGAPALDSGTQRPEHIQHEDAGSRVSELRVGGETRSISVQPKAGVPAYEVRPADASGTSAVQREAGPGSAGPRVWKMLQF